VVEFGLHSPWRCIPGDGVAPPSNTHGILDRRVWSAGRNAPLGTTVGFQHGLQALLQLLAVVIGRGLFDLRADLLHTALDGTLRTVTFDDGRVVLVDRDLLGLAQVLKRDVLELDAEVCRNRTAAGEDRDVFEIALRRSPKPWALTAATCSVPRSLFTTRVASASPSTSSATITSDRRHAPIRVVRTATMASADLWGAEARTVARQARRRGHYRVCRAGLLYSER
jgi:hypothetical protein